jgi:DNA-binding response OmpR family regulator
MELSLHSRSRARLDGIRVLVADDEILIALDIEATFTEAGAEVVPLCMTSSEALAGAASENVSVAILDIRLGQETSEAVAALLAERGIPFIFYSGQPLPNDMRERWPLSPLVVKPADPRQLVETVAALLSKSTQFWQKGSA